MNKGVGSMENLDALSGIEDIAVRNSHNISITSILEEKKGNNIDYENTDRWYYEDGVSVIIVTYNHKKYIGSCLESLLRDESPLEIIVVENCSTDKTFEYIKENYPQVKLLKNIENNGYGGGNNLGILHAMGTYVVILNPDTVVQKGWLRELIKPLKENDNIITTPKILLYDGSMINTVGTINHFTGLTFTQGFKQKSLEFNQQKDISGISGACFALKKCDYNRLNGFDEHFFLYNEDSDFSWNALNNGFRMLMIPTSVIYHDYELNVPPVKVYHLEKNRYIKLKKYFRLRDYFTFSPSLFVVEIFTFGYALKFGIEGLKYKLRAMREGFSFSVNKQDSNIDKILANLEITIPENQLTSNWLEKAMIRIGNHIFTMNFAIYQFFTDILSVHSGILSGAKYFGDIKV